jgi:Fe-S-cluster containining protein
MNASLRVRRLPVLQDGPGLVDAVARAAKDLDAGIARLRAGYTQAGRTIPCRSGCSGCCHVSVEVQILDLWPIVDELRRWPEADRARFRQRLDAALETAERAGIDLWHVQETGTARERYAKAGIPCPFLLEEDGGRCSIYRVRPNPCRTHYVVDTDPAQCRNGVIVECLDARPLAQRFFAQVDTLVGANLDEYLTLVGGCNLLDGVRSLWEAVEDPTLTLGAWLEGPVPRQALARMKEAVAEEARRQGQLGPHFLNQFYNWRRLERMGDHPNAKVMLGELRALAARRSAQLAELGLIGRSTILWQQAELVGTEAGVERALNRLRNLADQVFEGARTVVRAQPRRRP